MQNYYNYLTTPSGKECILKEMKNSEYLILLKFLNGDNYKGFYTALDSLIKESIPDFDEYDICDKAYVYIANYYYSVKNEISVKGEKIDTVTLPLVIILDEIEKKYEKSFLDFNFSNHNAKIHYPKHLLFDDNDSISIDYISGLESVGNIVLDKDKIEILAKHTPIKLLDDLANSIKNKLNFEIFISNGVPGIKELKDNMLNPSFFYSIAYIYKDLLENFYSMQYMTCHYIRVDWNAILEMTPLELSILYKNFIEDKEKQNNTSKNNRTGLISSIDPNVSEALMGY